MSTAADAVAAEEWPLRVAAAVIRRGDGAVLLSLRPRHADQGGLWEFPGGKLEAREREIDGLARELDEELGIRIERATPVIRVRHRYPSRAVELSVFEVDQWQGEPSGREGQAIGWFAPAALAGLDFPAANLPITRAVGLPRLVLVTPPLGEDASAYLARLEACLDAGVRLVQLRLREADAARARRVTREAVRLSEQHDARLLVNGLPGEAHAAGAHGVHLSSARLRQLSTRPVGNALLLSAACHNPAELHHAEAIGADFAYLSPVHATGSHPGAACLGWHRLLPLARRARLPVYALGGMRAADCRLAVRAGCQGIAMMSGLWDSAAPGAVLARHAEALAAAAYCTRN